MEHLSMEEYKYICPTEQGYTQFKIGRRDQNRIFSRWKWNPLYKYEYYHKGSEIIVQKIPSILGCIFCTIGFPLLLLVVRVSDIKRTFRVMVLEMWQCKRYGVFPKEIIHKEKRPQIFQELLDASKM